jgi:hypothetical protein
MVKLPEVDLQTLNKSAASKVTPSLGLLDFLRCLRGGRVKTWEFQQNTWRNYGFKQ